MAKDNSQYVYEDLAESFGFVAPAAKKTFLHKFDPLVARTYIGTVSIQNQSGAQTVTYTFGVSRGGQKIVGGYGSALAVGASNVSTPGMKVQKGDSFYIELITDANTAPINIGVFGNKKLLKRLM